MVVCPLYGQTGRFTVWANGKQNSGLANFIPESRLPFVQISSIDPKTAAKAWNWYERRLWGNGTRISVWNISTVETGLPFQTFRCSRKFSTETTWQIVFHLLSNRIFGKLFVRGKQPVCVCACVFPGGVLFVSDQNDRQTESLSGQVVVILVRPLTGRNFELCHNIISS